MSRDAEYFDLEKSKYSNDYLKVSCTPRVEYMQAKMDNDQKCETGQTENKKSNARSLEYESVSVKRRA